MKKILVSLPDGVVKTIDKELIGNVGQTMSDTLRTIIVSWLSARARNTSASSLLWLAG